MSQARRPRRRIARGLDVLAIVSTTCVVQGALAQTAGTLDPIRAELITAVEQAVADGIRDVNSLEHTVRRLVGRWVDRTYRRRPMLIPMVVEV